MNTKDAWTNPREVWVFEGQDRPFACRWLGTGTLSTPVCEIYLNGETVTSTVFTTGSDQVTGRIQVSKIALGTAWVGGETYVLVWTIVEGSSERTKQTLVHCLKKGQVF